MYSQLLGSSDFKAAILNFRSHGIDEHLHLVRSRHLQPIQTGVCPFDLERLQSDVIKTYLAGKPFIHQLPDHGHDQIIFKFKNEQTHELVLEGADLDLSVISEYIKEEFKVLLINLFPFIYLPIQLGLIIT